MINKSKRKEWKKEEVGRRKERHSSFLLHFHFDVFHKVINDKSLCLYKSKTALSTKLFKTSMIALCYSLIDSIFLLVLN